MSTGQRGYETSAGSFHPVRLEWHSYSHKYDNAPTPWSVFFDRGYAVHGTAEAYSLGHAIARLRAAAPGQCDDAVFVGAQAQGQ